MKLKYLKSNNQDNYYYKNRVNKIIIIKTLFKQ